MHHKTVHALALAPILALAAPLALPADTTIDSRAKHTHAANTGWITLSYDVGLRGDPSDGINVHGTFLAGHAYAANLGWISFGDGSPSNGHTYTNRSAADYGVNHDQNGNLSGYAYAANAGWINFGWARTNDANRPRVDHATGALTGFAYAANIGWLNLAADNARTTSITRTDTDRDNIPDAWEIQYFRNLNTASVGTDSDGDGESDSAEHSAGTDPGDPSSYLHVSITFPDGRPEIVITLSPTYAGRTYRILHSTDTMTWAPARSVGSFLGDPSGITKKTIPFPSTPGPHLWRIGSNTSLNSD